MADSGIPEKLLPAVRIAVFWIALPFILLLVGIERIFDSNGTRYQVLACFVGAFLSVVLAVYWDRIIPRRFRAKPQRLEYLRHKDSELGSAIRDMVWFSAWARWFAARHLVSSGTPIAESYLLSIASQLVGQNLIDGDIEVRGRLDSSMDYEIIPQTHWRSTALQFLTDPRALWKMILIPRGGAEISRDGVVKASDPAAEHRTAEIKKYDSLIVDAHQFEKLWPRREPVADKKRRQLLRKALKRGLDRDEILKLLGGRPKWQLELLRFGLAGIFRF
jgi:hypothetical protein